MVTFKPACIGSQKGFRLLAVRILPECAPYIRKCLVENEFYYLNNDYKISEDGTLIERRSEFVPPIRDDFFQTGEENTPRINISAIVGKNGDGKSTIVEVIIRMLNNFAFDYEIGEKDSLKKAEGLCAELYYQLDGTFYRLDEKQVKGSRTVILCRYENDITDGRLRLSKQPLAEEVIKKSFFYTLVTNYSHYAYNTLEVDKNVEHGNDEEHWLHRVFHKNDGYQVPLSLHPYREEGIIDLNNETWLSKQRVLMTFVKSYISDTKGSSDMMKFNGKSAKELLLSDMGKSTLQEITLKRFFQNNTHRLLQSYINILRSKLSQAERKKQIELICRMLDGQYSLLFGKQDNVVFFLSAIDWLNEEGASDKNSDLLELLFLLEENMAISRESIGLAMKWQQFSALSWIQIQRLILLIDVCKLWDKGMQMDNINNPVRFAICKDSLFCDYKLLSPQEKCLHYIIYKTISVFETYTSYGNPCSPYTHVLLQTNRSNKILLIKAFDKLARDWEQKSHITLKMRQAYNFYKDTFIQSLYSSHKNEQRCSNNEIKLKFSSLSIEQKQKLTDMETLPPPILKWDILFDTKSDTKSETESIGNIVAMETFSSGEKQKLYCQSAIVYHLQNISSIASEQIHYRAVNLILEETELYFHPDWQRTFCNDLMEMIRSANVKNIDSVNITFVTHSPYILSDIPKTNVLFLKDGRPDYSMQENTFGANINTLLKNGFFLPSLPIGEFAHQKINSMFAKLQSGEFDKTKIDKLKSEVMMVGEPYIRQQLVTLLKMYMGIDKNLVMECIRELYLEQRKHD